MRFAWEDWLTEDLLDLRLCDLGIRIEGTWLEALVGRIHRELARRDAEEWGELYCGGMIEKSIREVIASGRDGPAPA